jgi:transposase InsO family protein
LVIDRLSRFVWTQVKRGQFSTGEIFKFINDTICREGMRTRKILSDNGPQFRKEWAKRWRLEGVVALHSSNYYPQGNGLSERGIQTIQQKLRCCLYDNVDLEMEIAVKLITDGYNSLRHSSTGVEPVEIFREHKKEQEGTQMRKSKTEEARNQLRKESHKIAEKFNNKKKRNSATFGEREWVLVNKKNF